jgi:hypothetical protein
MPVLDAGAMMEEAILETESMNPNSPYASEAYTNTHTNRYRLNVSAAHGMNPGLVQLLCFVSCGLSARGNEQMG